MLSQYFKTRLPLIGTLAFCGCLCAYAQNTNQIQSRPAPQMRRTVGPQRMFEQSLNLSDEQAKKLEPVFREQQARMSALRTNTTLSRQERIAGFNSIREATDEKMKPHLTPEQLEKLQKSRAGVRAFSHGLTNQVNKPIKDKAPAEDEKKQPAKTESSTNASAAPPPIEAK